MLNSPLGFPHAERHMYLANNNKQTAKVVLRYSHLKLGQNKLGNMDKNGFESIIADFAPRFESLKPLARETCPFPMRDGAIFAGTLRDHNGNIMYNGLIEAFNMAIGPLGEEQVNA